MDGQLASTENILLSILARSLDTRLVLFFMGAVQSPIFLLGHRLMAGFLRGGAQEVR